MLTSLCSGTIPRWIANVAAVVSLSWYPSAISMSTGSLGGQEGAKARLMNRRKHGNSWLEEEARITNKKPVCHWIYRKRVSTDVQVDRV